MSSVIWLAAVTVGFLFASGLYMMLSWNVQRIALGFVLLSNAVNLSVIASSRMALEVKAPLISVHENALYADPLPQAFILTAIVIGLGTTVYLLAIAVRHYRLTEAAELNSTPPIKAGDEVL